MRGERFLTRADVVQMVGLSKTEIYRLMTAGRFPRNRVYPTNLRRRFWLQSDVEAWMLDTLAHSGG